MQKIIKHLSKYTGNISFVASKNENDYLFYVTRNGIVSYIEVNKPVEGLCYQAFTSGKELFLCSCGDHFLRQFNGTTLNETFLDTGAYHFHEMVNGEPHINTVNALTDIFGIDTEQLKLVKFTASLAAEFNPLWEIELVDFDFTNTNLIYRESNKTVILSNNDMVWVIRDDTSNGVILTKMLIPGDGVSKTISSGEFNPEFTYLRYRQVSGRELEQSSSSSSLSSESSSSSPGPAKIWQGEGSYTLTGDEFTIIGDTPVYDVLNNAVYLNNPESVTQIYCMEHLMDGTIDVSRCILMDYLDLNYNHFTDINVLGCIGLTYFDCSNNFLTTLNVSGCTNLVTLNCSFTTITSINVSGCIGISALYVPDGGNIYPAITTGASATAISTLIANNWVIT